VSHGRSDKDKRQDDQKLTNTPDRYWDSTAGCYIIHKCTTVRHALSAQKSGVGQFKTVGLFPVSLRTELTLASMRISGIFLF
jgi:hypothetical protein